MLYEKVRNDLFMKWLDKNKNNDISKKIKNRMMNWKKKNNSNKRKLKIPVILFTILNVIFTLVFIVSICKLNLIPMKYIVLIIFLFIIVNIGILLLISRKKNWMKYIGYGLSVIMIIVSCIGIYYISKTNSFLNQAFNNASNYYTNTYYIVTLNSDKYKELSDVKILGYYENMPEIDNALLKLDETYKVGKEKYKEFTDLLKDLNAKKMDAAIIESSLYNVLIKESNVIHEKDYKIVYQFDITVHEQVDEIKDDGNNFSIYIGGTDFTEKNNDFNMVITINKKTHKILLTSIPRDYYVMVNGKGMKDILGYAGYSGIQTSRKTVEDIFDTNIDYFIKINTDSLVGLVDTLGGVEYCSDVAYTTTHAMVTGTYDDTKGEKLYVQKGCRNYNGIQILTISRERLAFPGGDKQRQINCQNIMISIFKKMLRPENLTNYTNVLNAVNNLYTTNIPRDLVTALVKDTIDNGASWSIEQQSVTGSGSRGYVHMGTIQDYVMVPDQASINAAIANIQKIKAGK